MKLLRVGYVSGTAPETTQKDMPFLEDAVADWRESPMNSEQYETTL